MTIHCRPCPGGTVENSPRGCVEVRSLKSRRVGRKPRLHHACSMTEAPFVSFLTGYLTLSNGLPNGSDFCKCFQTRNVDGLTGFFAVFGGMGAKSRSDP